MTHAFELIPVVEGHGEVVAVPGLLRRMAAEIAPEVPVSVHQPIRVPRSNLVKAGELERYVELAARFAGEFGGVLVLLDADDDCPAQLGPALLQRAMETRPGINIAVVLANREFEAWFLASAVSLRGRRGLPDDLEPPENPEGIRNAKGWLQEKKTDRSSYSPTVDQPALVSSMDLGEARQGADSFDKLWRDLEAMLRRAKVS